MSLLELDNNFDNFVEELIVRRAINKFLYNYELYNLKCHKSRIDGEFRIEIIGKETFELYTLNEIIETL